MNFFWVMTCHHSPVLLSVYGVFCVYGQPGLVVDTSDHQRDWESHVSCLVRVIHNPFFMSLSYTTSKAVEPTVCSADNHWHF